MRKDPEDTANVYISEKWEVNYWTRRLHATAEEINIAIERVGNSLNAIKTYLAKQQQI